MAFTAGHRAVVGEATGRPRRWGRVVDVMGGGAIYTEDAERLVLEGVRWPDAAERRAEAEAYLTGLVHDKIIFYEVSGVDGLGRLRAEVWVGEQHVNALLRGRGYG